MAQQGSFPRAYINQIPAEGSDPMIEHVPFDRLGIGARKSAMPSGGVNNIRSLDHVGGSQGGAMRDRNAGKRPK